MGAVSEGALGKLSQYWDVRLESVIILELVSQHAADPKRRNKPRGFLFRISLGKFVNANYKSY